MPSSLRPWSAGGETPDERLRRIIGNNACDSSRAPSPRVSSYPSTPSNQREAPIETYPLYSTRSPRSAARGASIGVSDTGAHAHAASAPVTGIPTTPRGGVIDSDDPLISGVANNELLTHSETARVSAGEEVWLYQDGWYTISQRLHFSFQSKFEDDGFASGKWASVHGRIYPTLLGGTQAGQVEGLKILGKPTESEKAQLSAKTYQGIWAHAQMFFYKTVPRRDYTEKYKENIRKKYEDTKFTAKVTEYYDDDKRGMRDGEGKVDSLEVCQTRSLTAFYPESGSEKYVVRTWSKDLTRDELADWQGAVGRDPRAEGEAAPKGWTLDAGTLYTTKEPAAASFNVPDGKGGTMVLQFDPKPMALFRAALKSFIGPVTGTPPGRFTYMAKAPANWRTDTNKEVVYGTVEAVYRYFTDNAKGQARRDKFKLVELKIEEGIYKFTTTVWGFAKGGTTPEKKKNKEYNFAGGPKALIYFYVKGADGGPDVQAMSMAEEEFLIESRLPPGNKHQRVTVPA
jgi:hypothetical protein